MCIFIRFWLTNLYNYTSTVIKATTLEDARKLESHFKAISNEAPFLNPNLKFKFFPSKILSNQDTIFKPKMSFMNSITPNMVLHYSSNSFFV